MVTREISAIEIEYKKNIRPALKVELGLKNIFEVPKLTKIVVNTTNKYIAHNRKSIGDYLTQIELITGQKAIVTKMKKSISAFKVREGQPIGCKVTLRSHNMYHFYQKLIALVLPRTRDLRGFSANKFDGQANYTFGIKEQVSFFEISFDKFSRLFGLNVTLVTNAKNDYNGYVLLKKLGFPFNNEFKKI